MAKVYLSLGSNIGDRAQNIFRAIEALTVHGIRVMKQSSLYETEPVELRAQEWFLNSVIEVETNATPQELMHELMEIERSMGRVRTAPKGPRIIDMDILLYGSKNVRRPNL
jgi:2-amino-4-hydroxy-6-hydroxymethyldihydropteridine diphosphokinase